MLAEIEAGAEVPNATIVDKYNTLNDALELLKHNQTIHELIALVGSDLSEFDADSHQAFLDVVAVVDPLLDNVLDNIDKFDDALIALREAYGKLVPLDRTALQALVDRVDADMELYVPSRLKIH